MQKKEIEKIESTTTATRHYIRVVAFVVFGVSLGAFLMLQAYPYLESRTIFVDNSNGEDNASEDEVFALTRELPVRLKVPKLGIDTTFEAPLGLNSDGTINVPKGYEEVGWYKLGAAPGEIGTASILGHVDSYEGPAVFFTLGQLEPGDQIEVERADGSVAVFEVEYSERYKQEEFPTEKVYTPTPYPSLRLITCSGTYLHGTQRYTHNLVVYARLVEAQ
jgi:sortase (surface protein transpeptidase)